MSSPLTETERRDFWEICEDRYQTRSMILTSQLPVARWHEQIGDPTVADGILDRLVHNVSEAAGQGTKMADHFSPIFRPAFPSSAILSERSSPSRVRFAAPNNGAPLTAPGRSGQHF